jgi:hypothetical protein
MNLARDNPALTNSFSATTSPAWTGTNNRLRRLFPMKLSKRRKQGILRPSVFSSPERRGKERRIHLRE